MEKEAAMLRGTYRRRKRRRRLGRLPLGHYDAERHDELERVLDRHRELDRLRARHEHREARGDVRRVRYEYRHEILTRDALNLGNRFRSLQSDAVDAFARILDQQHLLERAAAQ